MNVVRSIEFTEGTDLSIRLFVTLVYLHNKSLPGCIHIYLDSMAYATGLFQRVWPTDCVVVPSIASKRKNSSMMLIL